jgi:dihydroneopterin aldolase
VITVEIRDLRVFGRHGVHEEERQRGQDFLFEVARAVQGVSDVRRYALLEALASAVADELERRFSPGRLRVRVRKPAVRPAGLDGTAGVTVTRP